MGDHIKPTSTIIFIPKPEKYFETGIPSNLFAASLGYRILLNKCIKQKECLHVMGSSKPGCKTKGTSWKTQV